MARQSLQDPTKKVVPGFHCDFKMTADLWRALEAYRARKGAKRAHAVRALLSAALRATGDLAPLLRPEDVPGLEDAYAFPWGNHGGPTSSLAWFSKDPTRLTWATLFEALESETQTSTDAVARRHGISRVHANRVYRRYDAWRRGYDYRPRLDPFAPPRGGKGPTKKTAQRRKKNNAKASRKG